MAIRNYADLVAWQKAVTLAESIYRTTDAMPREEQYGLTSQMRRAAVSIPSNIAEGQGRRSDGEFLRMLSIAHGSLRELETQVLLANRLQFLRTDVSEGALEQCHEVGRLVNGLISAIRSGR